MVSESARMSSAAEARFRLQAPNAIARATAIIALEPASDAMVRRLADGRWNRATFLTTPVADPLPPAPADDGWLADLAERRTRVRDVVGAADQVILVATAGGDAGAASMIGRACSLRRVTTTALIVGTGAASDEQLSKTLAQLRPWSLMVVIANNDDYVADLMAALRV